MRKEVLIYILVIILGTLFTFHFGNIRSWKVFLPLIALFAVYVFINLLRQRLHRRIIIESETEGTISDKVLSPRERVQTPYYTQTYGETIRTAEQAYPRTIRLVNEAYRSGNSALLQMAQEVAEGIDHPYFQATAYRDIASARAFLGLDPEAALDKASEVANKIQDDDLRTAALRDIDFCARLITDFGLSRQEGSFEKTQRAQASLPSFEERACFTQEGGVKEMSAEKAPDQVQNDKDQAQAGSETEPRQMDRQLVIPAKKWIGWEFGQTLLVLLVVGGIGYFTYRSLKEGLEQIKTEISRREEAAQVQVRTEQVQVQEAQQDCKKCTADASNYVLEAGPDGVQVQGVLCVGEDFCHKCIPDCTKAEVNEDDKLVDCRCI